MNFWKNLPKPFSVLAPMEDVTDVVFREMVQKFGRPDIFFTEFVNIDGLTSEKGFFAVSHRLKFLQNQKPVVAQIWGTNPEKFFKSAKTISELGFDGVDINMGCPQRKIIKNGSCSALIKNPNLAKEIILATRDGVGGLPLSVKTRIGFEKIITEEWISFLLEQNLDAIIIHGRTQKEMSKVQCHWDEIGKAVLLKNQRNKNTIIVGNGDVESFSEIEEKHKIFGVDGVMIGRGIFKNPWIFSGKNSEEISKNEKLKFLIEHIKLFTKTWKISSKSSISKKIQDEENMHYKNFSLMKKFFKIYINGWDGASEFREKLNRLEDPEEIINLIQSNIKT